MEEGGKQLFKLNYEMDDIIRDMVEFQKSMGVEYDAHENIQLSEKGMLAIEAERKKKGKDKDKNKDLEEVKEEDDDEKDEEEEKKEDIEPKARPGPGQKRIIAPYWDLSGRPEQMSHQQMQDEIKE